MDFSVRSACGCAWQLPWLNIYRESAKLRVELFSGKARVGTAELPLPMVSGVVALTLRTHDWLRFRSNPHTFSRRGCG